MNLLPTTHISKFLSAFLLCCSFLLMALPWLGKWSATLELLAISGFFVLAADIVMLLWHSAFRQRLFILVDSAALLLALFPVVVHIPFGTGKAGSDDTSSLTVVSWNVDNFSLNRSCLEELAYVMQTAEPDIICVQERPHQHLMSKASITSCFPDYPYVAFNNREDEVLNLMVLSKYPLSDVKTVYFPKSYNKYMSADVDIDGKKLHLYNVHLQTTSVSDNASSSLVGKLNLVIDNAEKRNQQADRLSDDINSSNSDNIIVCGDFNSPLFSYSCQTVASGLNDASWKSPLLLFKSSYTKSSILPKIDHIFYKGGVGCDEYGLIEGSWTDHKMQKAVFTVY
jgi:endonuclease/exonuclease/phosphatase (EEP) superfamily protein YafD